MRTRNRLRSIVAMAAAFMMVFASVAVADTANVNDVETNGNASREAGTSATARAWLVVDDNATDPVNGCNANTSNPVTITLSSSNTSVVTVETASQQVTGCDSANGASFSYAVASNAAAGSTATLTATASGGRTSGGGSNLPAYTRGSFTVTVSAPQDSTAPVITPNVTGTTGDNGWYTSDVSLTWSVVDNESSISARSGCDAASITADQQSTTYTCTATSAGGTSSESVSIKRDATAPVVNPSDVANSVWRNSLLSQAFTASDAISGLANAGDATFTLTASAESVNATTPTTDSRTVTDAAGNSTTRSLSALIDKTAPVVSGLDVNNTPWRNTSLSESFTAADALSGLADTADGSFTLTAAAQSADASTPTTVSKTVADKAGNTSTRTLSAFIDTTPPVVTVTGVSNGTSYVLGSVPAASCSTTDALSGVKTQAAPDVTGGPVGSVTVTCSGAEDTAGNTNTASVTYSVVYDFDGFFRPIENLPTLNRIKAGSAAPVKFSLGDNQGLAIFAPGFPKSVTAACDASAPVDAVEETVTAGSSSLSYDALTGQYNYVWKTEKNWTGCRQLQVKFIDGTVHTANFNFTK